MRSHLKSQSKALTNMVIYYGWKKIQLWVESEKKVSGKLYSSSVCFFRVTLTVIEDSFESECCRIDTILHSRPGPNNAVCA